MHIIISCAYIFNKQLFKFISNIYQTPFILFKFSNRDYVFKITLNKVNKKKINNDNRIILLLTLFTKLLLQNKYFKSLFL